MCMVCISFCLLILSLGLMREDIKTIPVELENNELILYEDRLLGFYLMKNIETNEEIVLKKHQLRNIRYSPFFEKTTLIHIKYYNVLDFIYDIEIFYEYYEINVKGEKPENFSSELND